MCVHVCACVIVCTSAGVYSYKFTQDAIFMLDGGL